MDMDMDKLNLRYIAAPMVNQSDLPFRLLVRKYGVTLPYTQMYIPEKLLNDRDYLEYHLRDLSIASDDPLGRPVVAQLCGNDPEVIVKAGRKIQGFCDAIGKFFCGGGCTVFVEHFYRLEFGLSTRRCS